MDSVIKLNKSNVAFSVLVVLSVIISLLTNRNSPVIGIYAILYGFLILKLFKDDDFHGKIYFLTLLYSILNINLCITINRYSIQFYYFTTAIYLIFMVRNYKKYNLKELLKSKYIKFLIAFLLYIVTSILWSQDKHLAIKTVTTYFIMISFMFVIIDYNKKRENLTKTVKYLFYMVPGIVLIGLIETTGFKFNIRNHYFDEKLYDISPEFIKKIPTTFFYNPNDYAVFIVMAMAFLLWAIVYINNKKTKWFAIILFFLLQINLIFTTSRTAWISLYIVGIFAALLFLIYRRKAEFIKTACIIGATLVVFYIFSSIHVIGPFFGKFYSTVSAAPTVGAVGSTNERYTLIVDIVNGVLMKGHLFGFGTGNSGVYIKALSNTNGITNPHSMWFEIMGDYGIFVFLAYIGIYVMMMYDLYKAHIKGESTKLYNIPFLTCSFGFIFLSFGPSSVLSFTSFWIMMGLVFSYLNCYREARNENTDTCKLVSQ